MYFVIQHIITCCFFVGCGDKEGTRAGNIWVCVVLRSDECTYCQEVYGWNYDRS